jgi:hypothetical protein
MENKMPKFVATKITFVSKEGDQNFPVKTPVELTGENVWGQANAYLRCWALEIPECCQGSSKTDFIVTYENDDIYEGRYDLYRKEASTADLANHISSYQTIWLADNKPAYIKDEEWKEGQERAKHYLDNYELLQGEICIDTWQILVDMCAEYPVMVTFGDRFGNPVKSPEFRIKQVHVWVKTDYIEAVQPPDKSYYVRQIPVYSFSYSGAKDAEYFLFPGTAESIYEVVKFAYARTFS